MKRPLLAALLLSLFLILVMALARRPIGDYTDPGGPAFAGNYGGAAGGFDGRLRIVSWNIHYGENLEQVIATLENVKELQDADILLLQEVSAKGVEAIAKRLGYNYVAYPAVLEKRRGEEYANAILSKWPLEDPKKIVLPNWWPGFLESRNAARATISPGKRAILIYSLHLDVFWMVPKWEKTQGEYLVKEVGNRQDFIILGGDFNTWTPSSILRLENGLEKVGLERLTRGSGYTFAYSGLKFVLDHIFSTQGLVYQAGVYRQTEASDHYPVWADIEIGNE